jgi:hypothetical protein
MPLSNKFFSFSVHPLSSVIEFSVETWPKLSLSLPPNSLLAFSEKLVDKAVPVSYQQSGLALGLSKSHCGWMVYSQFNNSEF